MNNVTMHNGLDALSSQALKPNKHITQKHTHTKTDAL